MKKLFKPILFGISALMVLGLTACGQGGGGIGAPVENRDPPPEPRSRVAVVQDVEVTYFRDTVYANIFRAQQCRECHVTGGGGNGAFADDNVNTAYSVALTKFNPASSSADVTNNDFTNKIRSQHYCWTGGCESSAQAMAAQLQAWVDALTNGGTVVDNNEPAPIPKDILTDPLLNPPSAPVSFDDDITKFDAVYDIVTRADQGNCVRCHSSTTTDNPPQRPFFAETGYANAKLVAYQQVKEAGVVNLGQPAASKLVVRPWPGQHNCSGDCQARASQLQAAITAWSDAIQAANPNPEFNANDQLRPSRALTLDDGQITSGGARYDDYVIAKYEFSEGSGNTAGDSSPAIGEAPEKIDLRLFGNVRWVGGYGLQFGAGGQARSISVAQSQKLHDLIVARGEYSLEAWVIPDNTSQEGDENIDSTVIMSYSSGTLNRNFTMGQDAYQYKMRNRVVDANGSVLATDMNENVVQTSLQHVVMTYSIADGRRIYVNGEPVSCETDVDTSTGEYTTPCPYIDTDQKDNAPLSQWDPGYLLTLGSDTNGDNQWQGIIKFAAIHRKALTQREININYDAGVGQKFNLLFSISHLKTDYATQWDSNMTVGDHSYIWFEVAEYDDYSYLFSEPKFIDLKYNSNDPNDPRPTINFTFRGMRIGVNGNEATVGQAFARLGKSDKPDHPTNNPADLTSGLTVSSPDPVSLTRLQGQQFGVAPATGTIIPKDRGVDLDQFFLTFERIGGVEEGSTVAATRVGGDLTLPFNYTSTGDPFIVGLRTFDEINATMAALTGVDPASVVNDDPNNDALKGFNTLKSQLPAEANISTFSASQQTAIASLAGRYCDKRVDDQSIVDGKTAEQYFGVTAGFFDSNVATAYSGGSSGTAVSNIADAIMSNMVRNVNTLGDGDADPLNNVIKPQLVALAAYLLGENDTSTELPQPHSCVSDVNSDGNQDQDCSGAARTRAIVKAMCTAVLSSAVVTQQ
jgi:hypothetical protein